MTPTPRAWLVDASVYIFRAYFGMPETLRAPSGQPLHTVHGYTRFLLQLLERLQPGDRCAAAFDESLGTNFRNALYPAYKQSRALPDAELAWQLSACRKVTELLAVPGFGCSRYEADDYLATLARRCRGAGVPVTVVSRDKDLGQLLRAPDDLWWDFPAGQRLDGDGFRARFGVAPERFADYLALVGDPVDDIPGVPGVGAKTATYLLARFAGLGTLGKNLDAVAALGIRGAARVAANLQAHWPAVLLARQLTGLEERIPGVPAPPPWQFDRRRADTACAWLAAMGLGGVLVRRCRALAAAREMV